MRGYLRPAIIGVVVLVLLLIPAAAVLARSYFLAPTAQPTKSQPIQFPHSVHIGLGLQCTYCHRTATTQANAGLPALQLCYGCHQVIPTQGRPELQKLVSAFQSGQPIDWNRVHQTPDHVHFVHATHIKAGFQCSTCHGDMSKVGKPGAVQVRDLRMGDCVACHKQNNARTDCAVCHY